MLSIGKLGKGQERYYLDKVAEAAEEYYSGEGEAEGQWLGSAAEALGLEGAVEADQLTAMLTLTSSPSWGRGQPIRQRRSCGTRELRASSDTARRTTLRTGARRLGQSRKTARRERGGNQRCGGSRQYSASY